MKTSADPRRGKRRAMTGLFAVLAACNLHEPNNDSGGAINLALSRDWVVAARGTSGLDVVRVSDGVVVSHLDPQGDASSYDDVAAHGDLIVALDADDGLLSSFTVSDAGSLEGKTRDLEVPSGPYAGVALGGERAVVSGGTSGISLLDVDAGGFLTLRDSLTAFRGQPDVSMLTLGRGAVLSTHFSGTTSEFVDGAEFGVSSLRVDQLSIADSLGLPGAGFTEGGGRPASWPVRAASDGDFVYVAHGGGLEILRVAVDLGLTRVSHLALETTPVDVAVSSGRAFVVGAAPARLVVVDVGSAEQPVVLRVEELSEQDAAPTAVVVTASTIFIAAGPAGLLRRER